MKLLSLYFQNNFFNVSKYNEYNSRVSQFKRFIIYTVICDFETVWIRHVRNFNRENCFGDHIASLECVFIWEDNYHELFPRVQFTCVRAIETADGVLAIKIFGNE